MTSLSRERNITSFPKDKRRLTVVLSTADYHDKVMTLLSDSTTEEGKRDPANSYKKIMAYKPKLEK